MHGLRRGLVLGYGARMYSHSAIYEWADVLDSPAHADNPRVETLPRLSLSARSKHGLERARESGVIAPMSGQSGLYISYTPALRRIARMLVRNKRTLPVLLLVNDKGPVAISAVGAELSLSEPEVISALANLLGLDLLIVETESVSITSSGGDVVRRVRSALRGATP